MLGGGRRVAVCYETGNRVAGKARRRQLVVPAPGSTLTLTGTGVTVDAASTLLR